MQGANGYYDSQSETLELSESKLEHLESVLSGESSNDDKLGALLGVYMLIVHETAHYGDELDGYSGGEPGYKFKDLVWFFDEDGNLITIGFRQKKFDEEVQKKIIEDAKEKNKKVLPTVPGSEKPDSDGEADSKNDKKDEKKNESNNWLDYIFDISNIGVQK